MAAMLAVAKVFPGRLKGLTAPSANTYLVGYVGKEEHFLSHYIHTEFR